MNTLARTSSLERVRGTEWALIAVLTGVQVTHIMDFVIIMPLGPQFMRVFDISPQQFAFLVSAYTFSAAISGFFGAFFLDRLDRKTALLGMYLGFTFGTLCCAIAPGYLFLLIARIVSGFFGGIMGAIVYAIVGDLIPEARRGAALGVLMSSFAVASILGLPLGLYLANTIGWHAPFYLMFGASLIIFVIGYFILPSVRTHMDQGPREKAWKHFKQVLVHPNHVRSFGLMVTLTISAFLIIPFISPHMVANVGVSERDLTYIYLFGGIFTLFSSRFVGKMSDRYGKLRVFNLAATISVFPIACLTILPAVPLPVALSVTSVFMVLMNARFVPAIAMITASVEAKNRGSFMSVNASVQQMASGLAAFIAGMIVTKAPSGALEGYPWAGLLSVFAALAAIWIAQGIQSSSKQAETPTT
jgi:predicted MFS family arabinose efflux permease